MPTMRPDFDGQPGSLRARQHRQAARIAGRRAHRALQPGDGLDVVVEHVGTGPSNSSAQRVGVALGVGDQRLDPRAGASDRGSPATHAATCAMPPSARSSRATIVSTAWSRPMSRDRLGDPSRLVGGGRQRLARVDQAEAAGAGAPLAEHHERRRAVGPAVAEVRAAGLLAHRDQTEVADRASSAPSPRGRGPPSGAATRACACAIDKPVGDTGLLQPSRGPHDARRDPRRARTATGRRADASRRRPAARLRRRPTSPRRAGRRRRRLLAIATSMPSSASDVTGLSAMPHGTMYSRR